MPHGARRDRAAGGAAQGLRARRSAGRRTRAARRRDRRHARVDIGVEQLVPLAGRDLVGGRRAELHPGRVGLRAEQRAHEDVGAEPRERVLVGEEQPAGSDLGDGVERQATRRRRPALRAAARTSGSPRGRSRASRTTRPGRPRASPRSARRGRSQRGTSPRATSRSRSRPARRARCPSTGRRRHEAAGRSGARSGRRPRW